jgi:hypothetical protein
MRKEVNFQWRMKKVMIVIGDGQLNDLNLSLRIARKLGLKNKAAKEQKL